VKPVYAPWHRGKILLSASMIIAIVALFSSLEARAASIVPRPDHVVIVIEENHAYDSIIGSPSAPYINQLARSGALFTNASAVAHPSEPNYLALFSGSTQGISDDSCPHTFAGPDLGGNLLKAHLSFGGYSESLPHTGFIGCISPAILPVYARKHNPWVNFTDVPASANLSLSSFPTNYDTLPTVSMVVPNLQNDMHDGTIQQGDTWLQNHIDGYVNWANSHNSLLIVTWDEDNGTTANHIPTIMVGPMVKSGSYATAITHYSVLRTLEDMYGLPYANNSANASPVSDSWK
jgi:phosphatidylinositol-3-phosphatase